MNQKFLGLILIIFLFSLNGFAQKPKVLPTNNEISGEDTTPPLLYNLPDEENIRNRAVYIRNTAELKKTLGERNVFDLIDFEGGTTGATAQYDAGKLLIIEYATPQASIDADRKLNQRLAEVPQNPPVYYRRVGNYAVFVFDGKDEALANALIEQVKYEKKVQWLGTNPYEEEQYRLAEKKYLKSTAELALSTVLFVVVGVSSTVLLGLLVGYIIFNVRKQKRSEMTAFSDAGGMTRLNLDGLSEMPSNKLLND
jgi:hypothetical protein